MSIYDFSDELRKGYWRGERKYLLSKLRETIKDAHKTHSELNDVGISKETQAVIRFFKEYVIQKSWVTPKDETVAGIMGISRAYHQRDISEEDYEKKIDKGRKILSVLRGYNAVDRKMYFMILSGARFESSWNQLCVDGIDYIHV